MISAEHPSVFTGDLYSNEMADFDLMLGKRKSKCKRKQTKLKPEVLSMHEYVKFKD